VSKHTPGPWVVHTESVDGWRLITSGSASGVLLMSDPPQDAWKTYGVEQKARAAIAKAEGKE
jgi:hypothetical protein